MVYDPEVIEEVYIKSAIIIENARGCRGSTGIAPYNPDRP
jgi:hypothetical protein